MSEQAYFDPKIPASYQSVESFAKNNAGVNVKRLKETLSGEEAYTLTRNVRTSKTRQMKVPLLKLNHQWDADLAFLHPDDGYKGFLLCVDVFSRQAHARAIKTTSAAETIRCFKDIFTDTKPSQIRSDGGTEFRASKTREFLKERGVVHYISQSTHQANYAESCIKTIKSKLTKYMLHNNTDKWVDVLEDVIYSYNNTLHSALGRTPASITVDNQEEALLQQYVIKTPKVHKKRPFKYAIGDRVRISYRRRAFPRAYDVKWTGEYFTVVKRYRRQSINQYKLKDYNEEPIVGAFYESDLQKIIPPEIFKIDQVVKTKGRGKNQKAYVKWKNWSSRFNSWIDANSLKKL